jgi:tRNA(fMet)-specific endonuclease VapC
MTEYLLDTNMVSDMVKKPLGAVGKKVRSHAFGVVGVSVVSAGEARFGYEKVGRPRIREAVEAVLGALPILPVTAEVAHSYAAARAQLERAGTPIGSNDLWIAAHALALGCILVTANVREFRRVPGLKVENWLA